jgi:hypothetical protein
MKELMMAGFILNPESLNKILQVAGNRVETLEYLHSALAARLKKSDSMPEYADVLGEIKKMVENAVAQEDKLDKLDVWSGSSRLLDKLKEVFSASEFSAFQDFMATKMVNNVPIEQIILDCQISDEGEFIRAYSIDGKVLEGDRLEAMDTLFNAWLAQAENNMIMQDGIIYSGTDKGEVIKDKSREETKARTDRIRTMLADTKTGFEHYVQQKKPQAQIEIRRHEQEVEKPTPQ